MSDETELISLDYKDLMNALKNYDKQMPNIGRKLISAVNNEAKKRIRRAYKAEGYSAKKPMPWGDAGYSKNLRSYANRDYSGKIMISQNAFQYRFIEFGTKHKEMIVRRNGTRYRVKSYSIPAHPLLYPIASQVWNTNISTSIMEKKFQEELNKKFKDK